MPFMRSADPRPEIRTGSHPRCGRLYSGLADLPGNPRNTGPLGSGRTVIAGRGEAISLPETRSATWPS
ncbi:hypothetical protein Taro_040024 [Colocasia esculenta]|uniref:Uncharacterized protein n=1 Tax=Colocasia esculenta TaxID=4460 RepID=A0A843WHG8_COLES|nr:hypothetical protein [Colocasia esculenta]